MYKLIREKQKQFIKNTQLIKNCRQPLLLEIVCNQIKITFTFPTIFIRAYLKKSCLFPLQQMRHIVAAMSFFTKRKNLCPLISSKKFIVMNTLTYL